jgi:aryl-alcohol dehydrogenase-like predicted oxidoreductase
VRIAIGTAQFGMPYGIANAVGQIHPKEAAAILHRAAQSGIDCIDTAVAYGDSEACLGEIGVANWEIITKLPPLPETLHDVAKWVDEQVAASLQRLRVPRLGALLLHRPTDLLGTHGTTYRSALRRTKERGLALALGVSIYDPLDLDALWPVFRPDLVQAPFNVLDRRLDRSGWLERMKKEGVRVHTRSTFLQGLLLMPVAKRPHYFQRWATHLDRWLSWCSEHDCAPLRVALGFALAHPDVQKVVVGVDSVAQLEEILVAASSSVVLPPSDLLSDDRDLIEPWRWKLA